MFWLMGLLGGTSVGVTLGLIGGGGSILAMPLMVHLLGVSSPHIAIGTAAVAVTANALANLALAARHNLIKWRCTMLFAVSGVAGAAAGAALGKRIDGQRLLLLFGLLMIVVGVLMFRPSANPGDPQVHLDRRSVRHLAPRLIVLGLGTGAVSGFFGIGGGFLIVPGLMAATGMTLAHAAASSLVSVTLFGAATSASYAVSGLVDWGLFAALVAGGAVGAVGGAPIARRLARRADVARRIFALMVIATAAYVGWRALTGT